MPTLSLVGETRIGGTIGFQIREGLGGASSVQTLPFVIPNDPAFVGIPINLQDIVFDPGAVDGFSTTNGVEFIINAD